MLKPSALLVLALAALSTAGCMTKRVQMQPSAAVLQARAHAQQAKAHPAPVCASVTLDPQTPMVAPFGYESTEISESGADALNDAADWLTCHPAGLAVVSAEADTTGTADHKRQVATERAASVKAYLASRGVAPGRVLDAPPAGGAQVLTITAQGRRW